MVGKNVNLGTLPIIKLQLVWNIVLTSSHSTTKILIHTHVLNNVLQIVMPMTWIKHASKMMILLANLSALPHFSLIQSVKNVYKSVLMDILLKLRLENVLKNA